MSKENGTVVVSFRGKSDVDVEQTTANIVNFLRAHHIRYWPDEFNNRPDPSIRVKDGVIAIKPWGVMLSAFDNAFDESALKQMLEFIEHALVVRYPGTEEIGLSIFQIQDRTSADEHD